MRRFRFSLESVLKVRRQTEEARQRELAAQQALRDRLLLELGRLESELSALTGSRLAGRRGRIDLAQEAWFLDRYRALHQAIRNQARRLARQEEEVEAARLRAVEAARERRVLEKLEESQFADWQQKLHSEEQGFLDELAQRASGSFGPAPAAADPA